MSESYSVTNEERRENSTPLPSANRRSVLKGLAALGLGSGAIGGAAAQAGGDGGDGSDGVSVGIQLYTLRNLPDTTLDLLRRTASVDNNGGPGYDVVEFAGLGDASTSEINATLDDVGMEAISAHISISDLEGDSLQDTLDTYSELGVTNYIDPSFPVDDLTVANIQALAERYNDIADNLPEGTRVGFHNHDYSFEQAEDGRLAIEVFDEYLNDDVIFEIDVGWVLTGGADPVDIIQQYSDRTELIHMKDMENGDFHEIGEGAVDMAEVARVAREEANVDALIYEHDQPENPAGSTGTGAGVLSFVDNEPGLDCLDFADVGDPDYSGSLSGVEQGDATEDAGVPIGIQLYTLRGLPDSVPEVIRRVGAVDNNGGPGYDLVEPYTLGDASVGEINAALDETGLNAQSAHVGLGQLEGDSFESTVQTYTSLGINTFIVPYVAPSDLNTVGKVEDLATRMNDVAADLEAYEDADVRLGYHTHDGEFQDLDDGRIPIEIFDEMWNENIVLELDVGWTLTAGYDPVEVMRDYSDRIEFIHMKDMENGDFFEIGEGGLDLETIAQVARDELDVEALIYEHDEPEDPAGSVATGAGVMSFLDGAPGLECLQLSDVGGPDYTGTLGAGGGGTEQVSVPFGYDSGGGELDGTVTIDGLEYVASSPAVTASGDASASSNGMAVAQNSFPDASISGTDNPALYQSETYGGNLSYEVAIPNGTYDVTFYFAENFQTEEDARVFDVSVEGNQVIEGLDIFAEVGHDAALTRTVEGVEVSDGSLSISTTTQVDNSKFSGFLIESAEGGDQLPPVVGNDAPTDPDGDGHFEDVNGNGDVNYDDVVDFFENFDDPEVQDHTSAYDFNENDLVDFDDVVDFFRSI